MNQRGYTQLPSPQSQLNVPSTYVSLQQAQVQGSGMTAQVPLRLLQRPLEMEIPATWQGVQPQTFVAYSVPQNISLVSPWATPGQYETFDPRGPRGATGNPLAVPLAQTMHGGQHEVMATVRLSPDDERILVRALKVGLAEGLTPRQIVERLQNTNSVAGIDWKDVFLDNVERLFPQIFSTPTSVPRTSYSSASQSQSSSSVTSSPVRFEPPPRRRERHRGVRGYNAIPHERIKSQRSTHSSRNPFASMSTASTSSSQFSSDPPRRRGSLLEFHANTLIPTRATSSKPEPPDEARSGSRTGFTDDDKIFLIHFLRWRLREGDVPEKSVLYRELATETPQHDAHEWRKHWDSAPSLPDRIYIEARKRADNNRALVNGRDLSESTHSSDDEEPSPNRPSQDGHPIPMHAALSCPATLRAHVWVTEGDLRRMAEFLVEKRHLLHGKSQRNVWTEFSRRRENKGRRSCSAWRSAAKYHALEIQQLVDEIMADLSSSESESEEREVVEQTQLLTEDDPPRRASKSTRSGRHESAQEEDGLRMSTLRKQSTESEDVTYPAEKRVKVETIDLTAM